MNSNSAAYRSDVGNISASNKQLQAAAYTKTDLDTLKNVGQEIGVNQGRKMLGKVAGQVYDFDLRQVVSKRAGKTLDKLGVRTLREADKKATSMVSKGVDSAKQYLSDSFKKLPDKVPSKSLNIQSKAVSETKEDYSSLRARMKARGIELSDGSKAEEAQNDAQKLKSIMSKRSSWGKASQGETKTGETKGGEEMGETKSSVADDAVDDGVNDGKTLASDALNDGADTAKSLASDALKGGADVGKSVAGDALEAGGLALDATGLGAIVGIPLQIAGAAVELGSVYEAGKSIVDFVEQDILHTAPPPKANLQKLPAFNSMNNRATIIPNFDTQMDVPSTSGSW